MLEPPFTFGGHTPLSFKNWHQPLSLFAVQPDCAFKLKNCLFAIFAPYAMLFCAVFIIDRTACYESSTRPTACAFEM